MKSTGIVRKLDELGRVVLPVELRKSFNIEVKDLVEIFVDEEYVILRKYEPTCVFCSNTKEVTEYKNKRLCSECIAELRSKA